MNSIRRIILVFSMLSVAVSSRAQIYDFRNLSVEDGLSQSQVLSLLQDNRGALWLGTNGGGVNRYDGTRFEILTHTEGLADNVVFSIAQDLDQKLWFGTKSGLSVYDGHAFINYTTDNGLPSERIYKVLADRNGNVWVGTAKGVAIWNGESFRSFEFNDSLMNGLVYSMYEDSRGRIWIGSFTNGALCYEDGAIKIFSRNQGLRDVRIRCVTEDAHGSIWLGTSDGLYKVTEGLVEEVQVPGLKDEQVSITGLLLDRQGVLWVSTYEGAFSYNGKTFTHIDENSGLASDNIWTLIQDQEGIIWFATSGKGVSGLRSQRFINFDADAGLSGELVYSLFEDRRGAMWVGTEDEGLSRLTYSEDSGWKVDPLNDIPGVPSGQVCSMEEDAQGRVWVGVRRGKVHIWDGKNFSTSNFGLEALNGEDVYDITRDRFDRMWLATFHGVYVVENNKATKLEIDTSLLPEARNAIYCIYEDLDGSMWFATDQGAIKNNGKSFQHFTKKSGLTDGRVRTILKDHEGHMWFGTDEGIFTFKDGSFKSIRQSNGLSSDKVYLMHFDRRGYLWLGTNRGLDRINLITLWQTDSLAIRHFGKSEGFLGVECNSNAVFEDRRGAIWFGTVRGAIRYQFKDDIINKNEPHTTLLDLRLRSKAFDWKDYADSIEARTGLPYNLTLPHDMRHLTFYFEAISLMAPEKVRYTYMLEGLENVWSIPTEKRDIAFPYLPSGKYTFKLKACNSDGVWNKEAVELGVIIIKPPFWQTPFFYIICTVAAGLLILSFIKYRERRLRQEKRVLEEMVDERTREVVEQKEIIEAKNKDITDSINYAKRIQEALLPPANLTSNAFSESFVLYQPKDIVSGDFYWFGKKQDVTILAAVDCTGHGVPGAFMSMIGHNLLNQIILEQAILDPGRILTELNVRLKQAFKQSKRMTDTRDGMDMALCAVLPSENKLLFAGAMRPLYLYRGNDFEEIKGNKQAIGGLTEDEFAFTTHERKLQSGDRFYIFSDGYADQFGGPAGKKFMSKQLRKIMAESAGVSMEDQLTVFHSAVQKWKGNEVQVDDILLIGVRY
ncbi:MAG: SpoIIE family protein phosphatase [Flavobacteriales bacterium]|nr:SpoIIE family protein phosphatase [Flavobacteriales bacterium]